jgi:23S rRNA pseudouridine2604 synthase
MVFTQNPSVARKITDDAAQMEHEWLAEVAEDPALEDEARRDAVLKSLSKALFFDGWTVPSARASWQSEQRLRLAIKGNLPGQVAHLVERAGLRMTALRRLRLGRIGLAGLPVGEWRYLMPYERF